MGQSDSFALALHKNDVDSRLFWSAEVKLPLSHSRPLASAAGDFLHSLVPASRVAARSPTLVRVGDYVARGRFSAFQRGPAWIDEIGEAARGYALPTKMPHHISRTELIRLALDSEGATGPHTGGPRDDAKDDAGVPLRFNEPTNQGLAGSRE